MGVLNVTKKSMPIACARYLLLFLIDSLEREVNNECLPFFVTLDTSNIIVDIRKMKGKLGGNATTEKRSKGVEKLGKR